MTLSRSFVDSFATPIGSVNAFVFQGLIGKVKLNRMAAYSLKIKKAGAGGAPAFLLFASVSDTGSKPKPAGICKGTLARRRRG